jgi:triose/dihydroxyacetone kinase / FAD-AMP lyase (cyclizing)
VYSGAFETSLNGPGFSISLCNLNEAAKASETGLTVEELLELLEAPTTAPAWPNETHSAKSKAAPLTASDANGASLRPNITEEEDIKGWPSL